MLSTYAELTVAQAVLKINATHKKPTQRRVIKMIGGSFSTIGPVFNSLKARFDNFANLDDLRKQFDLEKIDVETILCENESLQEKLKLLQDSCDSLERQLKILAESENYYKGVFSLLESERESIIKQISDEKNQQIDSLLAEVVDLHKDYANQYRDFSFNHDDKLLQKEVRIRELTDNLAKCEAMIAEYEQKLGGNSTNDSIIKKLRDENCRLVTQMEKFKSVIKNNLKEITNDASCT